MLNISLYLQLSKYIDSSQLCQIFLASYPIPVELFLISLYLVPQVSCQAKVQIVVDKSLLRPEPDLWYYSILVLIQICKNLFYTELHFLEFFFFQFFNRFFSFFELYYSFFALHYIHKILSKCGSRLKRIFSENQLQKRDFVNKCFDGCDAIGLGFPTRNPRNPFNTK